MRGLILAVIVLNLIDTASTLVGVRTGVLYEANPLAAILLSISPYLFLAVKVGLCGLLLPAFWLGLPKTSKWFSWGFTVLAAVYAAIAVWHGITWIRYIVGS